MGWERFISTGWVRTRPLAPNRIHASEHMVLLAGGWTRQRADNSPIVSNRVLYTLTCQDGNWGIQARFGIDSYEPGFNQNSISQAAIQSFSARLQARQDADVESWLTTFHYPLTAVLAPGRVVVVEDLDQLRNQAGTLPGQAGPDQGRIRVIAAGSTGALLSWHPDSDSETGREVALLAQRDGSWKTMAVSVLP